MGRHVHLRKKKNVYNSFRKKLATLTLLLKSAKITFTKAKKHVLSFISWLEPSSSNSY